MAVPRCGRGEPHKSWLGPKFSRTLEDTVQGQLILRKISKFDTTKCEILRLKRTKFDFRWGSAPHSTGGAYNALTP